MFKYIKLTISAPNFSVLRTFTLLRSNPLIGDNLKNIKNSCPAVPKFALIKRFIGAASNSISHKILIKAELEEDLRNYYTKDRNNIDNFLKSR